MFQRIGLVLGVLLLLPALVAAEDARLLRFPDIHGDQIAFSHGGDLWIVSANGGQARRLTTHDGLELFPRFSPDGKKIAFMGEYDGDQNVFVIDAVGGEPKRLTYHPAIRSTSERMGPESIVMDWTPDGKRILYRSREETHSVWEGKLYTVSPDGGFPIELPLPRGGFASFNGDGTKIAYCPIFRDFRTWKRYKGGTAQDVWIYDLVNARSEKLTDWEGTDNMPMWDNVSGKIYFNSDRTGTLNLFVYDPADKSTTQVTQFTEYDVRWPAMGPGAIVFENGGWLYVLDLPNGTPRKLSVQLGDDRLPARDRWINVKDRIQDYTVSYDGKRAMFGARGEIFTVPAKHGNTRNVTNTPGANEKFSTFSPNGQWIAYVSDASGEDELYLLKVNSSEPPVRLTTDGDRYKYQPSWSPDSKKLVWSDKSGRVFWIDITTKSKTMIVQGQRGDIRDYVWSPDSKFIAYSDNNEHFISQIWVYSLAENKNRVVTPGDYDDVNPAWDPQGKYLYYLSNRHFNPMLGNYEFNFVLEKMTEIHALILAAGSPSPFAPKSDEIAPKKDEAAGAGKEEKKDKDGAATKSVTVTIDWNGLYDRDVRLPVDAGQYGGLAAAEGRVFYVSTGLGGLDGPVEDAKTTLHVFVMEDQKSHAFLEGLDGYDLTPDGKKMIVRMNGKYEIIDAGGEKAKTGDNVLDLSKLEVRLDPRAEWKQIFEEGWRLQRDFFYDSLMHGVDWKKIHDRYAPLVDHVTHRFDLTYVLGEMIGELATGHTYVGGGDYHRPSANEVGLLGINFVVDSAARRYKIGRILEGENWRDDRRSPLTEPGIKASAGDYIIAINGKPLYIDTHPYALTEKCAGQTVSVTLSKSSDGSGSWTIEPKTIGDEEELRYIDWVARKARYTDSVSGGRIGYVHIPDMGAPGLKQFASMFFPQIRKEGMIIDVRWNGGGFVSQLIIERLRRVLSAMGKSRNFGPTTYPGTVFHGYLACLCNEHSASDGDNFPYHFRKYGLGPVIGKRTWGGVVGIRGHRSFTDGGYMNTPEFAKYDLDRNWIIENRGVDPDIDVEYPPEIVYKGGDPQIDRAVQEIMKQITAAPKQLPPPPATPPEKR
jgi:tricorn protease